MPQLITTREFMKLLYGRKGKLSLKDFAAKVGVSYQFLAHVLAGNKQPGPTMAKALGYEQTVAYRRVPRRRKRPNPKDKAKA